jgi:ABC-2 type transport system ATP-binding protein
MDGGHLGPGRKTRVVPQRLTPATPGRIIQRMMNNLVEIRGLTVDRGERRVLDGLDLTIEQGSVTGLLGPSGCGKSTLMRSLVGVQMLAGGSVQIDAIEAGSKELRHRLGYVTQDPSVYADLTVRENLTFFSRVLGVDPGSVTAAIERVDLTRHADQVVGRLSGGQLSRVGLAVALLGSPDLLVLDEPTVGLDPVLRRDLWGLFHGLAEAGAAVFVSSHVMDEADRCDRLLLMREGVIIADGTPERIRQQTGSADIESAFLALVDATAEKEGS